ncbi:hypothetical protein ABC347_01350 [Sphingomonas sp. 1P06PA]|uniref:hypothetical protein n=1 Tax=Sphingomonas sp. 1P06PA TaxID=554121 RepID=UPI0039A77C45
MARDFEPFALPVGQYRIDGDTDAMVRTTSHAPDRIGDAAHPIMAFVAALGGLGAPIADVCVMLGSSISVGPLLASCTIQYDRPLRIDLTYEVHAMLTGLIRKPSRAYGAADHAKLVIRLERDGMRDAEVALTWVLPVRGVAA